MDSFAGAALGRRRCETASPVTLQAPFVSNAVHRTHARLACPSAPSPHSSSSRTGCQPEPAALTGSPAWGPAGGKASGAARVSAICDNARAIASSRSAVACW